MPAGVSIRDLRTDAATYQAWVINYCEANDISYVTRAKLDASLKESMLAIKQSNWGADQTLWHRIGNRAGSSHLVGDGRRSSNHLSDRAETADG